MSAYIANRGKPDLPIPRGLSGVLPALAEREVFTGWRRSNPAGWWLQQLAWSALEELLAGGQKQQELNAAGGQGTAPAERPAGAATAADGQG